MPALAAKYAPSLIAELGDAPFDLIGTSFGGLLAQPVASTPCAPPAAPVDSCSSTPPMTRWVEVGHLASGGGRELLNNFRVKARHKEAIDDALRAPTLPDSVLLLSVAEHLAVAMGAPRDVGDLVLLVTKSIGSFVDMGATMQRFYDEAEGERDPYAGADGEAAITLALDAVAPLLLQLRLRGARRERQLARARVVRRARARDDHPRTRVTSAAVHHQPRAGVHQRAREFLAE